MKFFRPSATVRDLPPRGPTYAVLPSFLYHRWVDIDQARARNHARVVFTIGHSNHSVEVFLDLLSRHRIDALADVRSAPYSRFNSQFNRESLAAALSRRGIEYQYFGRELGDRPEDPACYEGDRVHYGRVSETERFREGLTGVIDAAARRRIALMCAEREPLDCHRTLLVATALDAHDVDVQHIHADGTLETQADAMRRLLDRYNLNPEGDLLGTREQSIAIAVTLRPGRRSAQSHEGRTEGRRTEL